MGPGDHFLFRWPHRLGWVLTALSTLAHLMILVALVVFGLRAGGWVFPPAAVAWYGLLVLGSLPLLARARRPEDAHWLMILPIALALALLGASGTSWSVGEAAYGPYDPGDRYRSWVLLQAWVGIALVSLAALYRWPSLLTAGLLAQTVLLLSHPEEWAGLVIWGWPREGVVVSFLPLVALYTLALWALRGWPPVRWRTLLRAGVAGVVLCAALFVALQFLSAKVLHRGPAPGGYLPTLAGALMVGGLGGPALLLGAASLKPPEPRRRFPAEAAALLLGGAALLTLSVGQFPPLGILPAPGEILPWISPDRPVPDVWLPTVEWAGWLLKAVLVLLVPLGVLGLRTLWPDRRVRSVSPETPLVLAGVGLLLLSLWEGLAGFGAPFLVRAFLHFVGWPSVLPLPFDRFTFTLPERLLSIPVGTLLLLAGRAWAAHPAAHWEERARPLGRAATLGLLAFGLWRSGAAAGEYLRVLTAMPPAWKASVPPPVIWASFGPIGVFSLLLFVLFAATTAFLLSAWWRDARRGAEGPRAFWRGVVLPPALVALAAGLAMAALSPRVVSTFPPNGAQGVPTDVEIQIQMGPPNPLAYLPGAGDALFVGYADTGEPIPGAVGFGENWVSFFPSGPLRPNAPVEVVIRRGWERPYRLRFTTGESGPPAPAPAHP